MDILALANQVLSGPGEMVVVRIQELDNDEAAHDDEAVELLYGEFDLVFTKKLDILNQKYGDPIAVGEDDDDEVVPLCGVLSFAVWKVGRLSLFLSLSHEDREAPILLMLGSIEDE